MGRQLGEETMVSEHQKPIESGFQAKSEPSDILAGIDLAGKTPT